MKHSISSVLFILISSILYGQGLEKMIDQSFKLNYKDIVSKSDSIFRLSNSLKKNDALLCLSYALINEFKFKTAYEVLSLITKPTPYQEGAIHQLKGVILLCDQKFSRATTEFKTACDFFSGLENHSPYFETLNDLVYAMLRSQGPSNEANIMLDQVVDHAQIKKDTALWVSALVNKLSAYPDQVNSVIDELRILKANYIKRILSLQLAKMNRDANWLAQAKNEISTIQYSKPIPIQVLEDEEIKLLSAELNISTHPLTAKTELTKLLKDSSLLPLGFINVVHSDLSSTYRKLGMNDSSAFHLLQIRPTGEMSDSLRNAIPVALANISKEDQKKDIYLILWIVSFLVSVVLLWYWVKGGKKKDE